jgi:glycosyltransferase involved in cell wall biosynthesis
LNFVSDAELESCYELAQCLIFASEGEGFGLPIIEASKRGLPLLLRDIPIFREVAGQSATYFPSLGFEELASEIEDWLNKYYSHALPDPKDLQVSTWSSSAETFMMEIRRLLF